MNNIIFKGKTIKLVYWRQANFGDALSPFIVGTLSQKKIIPKDFYRNKRDALKQFIKCIKSHRLYDIKYICLPWEKNLLAIGSIASYGTKRSIIWGSGFMNETETFNGGKIYAVRGHFTKQKIEQLGYQCPNVCGDPALLLPLIISASETITDVGIIPHWTETSFFSNTYGNNYKIIKLNTTNIFNVVHEITSCKMILSTSLHGLIVAHAYGIPAIWIKKGYISTDGFKFSDYFSSVDIPPYQGFTNIEDILKNRESITSFFKQYEHIALPHTELKSIQIKLLKSAPFKVKNIFKQKIF